MSAHFTQAALEDPGLYPLHLIIDQQEQLGQIASLRPPFTPHVWLRYRGKLNLAGFDRAGYRAAYPSLRRPLLAGRLRGLGSREGRKRVVEGEEGSIRVKAR